MNRRQAIKTGITAIAAILTITGCKSKQSISDYDKQAIGQVQALAGGIKERYGRAPAEPLTVKKIIAIRDAFKTNGRSRIEALEGIDYLNSLNSFMITNKPAPGAFKETGLI